MKASIHWNICHVVAVLIAAILAAACGDATPPIAPSQPGAALPTEVAHMPSTEQGAEKDRTWHNGEEYLLRFPSSGSANENQFTFGCFDLGPDQTGRTRNRVGTLYGVLLPGTTQDSCPDGSVQHDHVVSAIPGVPGYTPFWEVVFVQPGPEFDPAIVPLTSEAAILAAETAEQVVLIPAGFVVHASIVGRAR